MSNTPATKQFYEYLGFFEDIVEVATGRVLGTRKCNEQPGREMGQAGAREETLVESVTLDRGHKTFLVKASPDKPVLVRTTYLPICGRMSSNVHSHIKQ